MGKGEISTRLAIGICVTVTAILLSVAIANPNPGAKPLTVKANVAVDANSGSSPSAIGLKNECDNTQSDLQCFKYGERGCGLPCSAPCCEGLFCRQEGTDPGYCTPIDP